MPAEVDVAFVVQHVVARITATEVLDDPFPRMVIDDALPQDVFNRAIHDLPPSASMNVVGEQGWDAMAQYTGRGNNTALELAGTRSDPRVWAALHMVFDSMEVQEALLNPFRPRMTDQMFAQHEKPMRREVEVQCDSAGSYLKPHTDGPSKCLASVLYLDCGEPDETCDTLFYRPRDPAGRAARWDGDFTPSTYVHEEFEDHILVGRSRWRPNRMLTFLRSFDSVHGVAPLSPQAAPRYILLVQHKYAKPASDRTGWSTSAMGQEVLANVR
jgi:hypothetical protein